MREIISEGNKRRGWNLRDKNGDDDHDDDDDYDGENMMRIMNMRASAEHNQLMRWFCFVHPEWIPSSYPIISWSS